MTDVLFIVPNNANNIYQELSNKYSAVETPTWALLLAQSCRSIGFKVSILDTLAESLDDHSSLERIKTILPKIIVFVVYGQNVNSGTTSMSGATRLVNFLKKNKINIPIAFVGSHVQALPKKTLEEEKNIDLVFLNEGVYSLRNLLKTNCKIEDLKKIKGIAYRNNNEIIFNEAEDIVPQNMMDIDLPGYAWDLLPFKEKPFDLYRSPMWHAEYDEAYRSPYAAIQTSLGCQFKCNFCMINIINKNDSKSSGTASDYSGMRYWSTEFIFGEFKKLINLGVKTIKITDEMFLLNQKFYLPLCKKLSELNKDDDLKIWAYSRIDTVKKSETLKIVRSAGIKWLCLGIESGDKKVRIEVTKGKFEDVDVRTIIKKIHDNDIEVLANYIFGLPGDTLETMQKTLDLSIELCTSGWNGYAAMALPGSKLYNEAIKRNYKLPKSYEAYSFHSYDTQPLPTETLEPYQILKFRDKAFDEYHNNQKFLDKIKRKFGNNASKNIQEMTKIKLKRKIIEESEKI